MKSGQNTTPGAMGTSGQNTIPGTTTVGDNSNAYTGNDDRGNRGGSVGVVGGSGRHGGGRKGKGGNGGGGNAVVNIILPLGIFPSNPQPRPQECDKGS